MSEHTEKSDEAGFIFASPKYEIAYADLVALVQKHAAAMSAVEMLAVAANMVGKLVAMQDQRKITPKQAMEVVAKNVEVGNQQVIEILLGPAAGRA